MKVWFGLGSVFVGLAFAGGQRGAASPPAPSLLRIRLTEAGSVLLVKPPGEVEAFRFSPDGRRLLLVSVGPTRDDPTDPHRVLRPFHSCLTLLELPTGKLLWQRHEDSDAIRTPAFSPDGRTLATIDRLDHSDPSLKWVVHLRAIRDGAVYATLPHADYGGDGIAFSPDSKTLAIGDFRTDSRSDAIIRLFGLSRTNGLLTPTGKESRLRGIPWGIVSEVTFSPDGAKVAAEIYGGEGPDAVSVWDLPSGRQLYYGEIEGCGVEPLFLRGGRELLFGGLRMDVTPRKPKPRNALPISGRRAIGVFADADFALYRTDSGRSLEVWDVARRQRRRRMVSSTPFGWAFCPAACLLAFRNAEGWVEMRRVTP